MNQLIHLASFGHHHSYGNGYGYGYHHLSGLGWIGHMVVSSIIHAMIYSVVFRAMSHLTLTQGVILVVVAVALLFWFSRRRQARRW